MLCNLPYGKRLGKDVGHEALKSLHAVLRERQDLKAYALTKRGALHGRMVRGKCMMVMVGVIEHVTVLFELVCSALASVLADCDLISLSGCRSEKRSGRRCSASATAGFLSLSTSLQLPNNDHSFSSHSFIHQPLREAQSFHGDSAPPCCCLVQSFHCDCFG